MKRIVLFVLSLFLLSFFVPIFPSGCQAAVLDGEWQYRLRPDTGEWTNYIENTPIPVQVDVHEVWLRIPIKAETPQADTLLFTTKGQAVQIFLGDREIYRDGEFAPQQPWGHGRKWHLVTLPAFAEDTYLTMHIYADSPRQLGIFGRLTLDSLDDQARRIFLTDLLYIITLPVAVLLGLIFLMYVMNSQRHKRLNRHVLTLLVLMAVWTVSLTNVKQMVWNYPVFWDFVSGYVCYLLPMVANAVVLEMVSRAYRKIILRTIQVYGCIAILALVTEAFGYEGFIGCRQLLYAALLLLQTIVGWVMWQAAQKGNVYLKYIMIPMVVMGVLGIADGILFYRHFWNWHVYLLPLSIYTFVVFIVCMVRDQVMYERSLAAQADGLQEEIAVALQRAEQDELTGCRNRGAFEGFIQQQIAAGQPFSLIMLDIDFFKKINDTYGHDCGDAVLVKFCRTIETVLPQECEFFRWGGEEFVVYCPDGSKEEAAALAGKICHRVAAAELLAGNTITVSAGVAQWHGHADTQAGIFRRMDDALYSAKCGGRNQVVTES
jgi:diguanylate cyclase (GGDEF)-like protein